MTNEIERWDSAAPGLVTTRTFLVGHKGPFCAYCCEPAKPIQAGLRGRYFDEHERDYRVTGHTCTCKGAKKDAEFRAKYTEMINKHEEQKIRLISKYCDILQPDVKKRIKLEYELKLKDEYWGYRSTFCGNCGCWFDEDRDKCPDCHHTNVNDCY